MRSLSITILLVLLLSTVASAASVPMPETLRGGIDVNKATIDKALLMQDQGWEYVMPQPKSKQAKWGNSDGRTTWWVGYWKNNVTRLTSSSEPKLVKGKYKGDSQGGRNWRRGGSPGRPSKIEWLLSQRGGIHP